MKLLSLAFLVLLARLASAREDEAPQTPACSSITKPRVPGADVVSIEGTVRKNVTIEPNIIQSRRITGLEFCDVKVILSHPGANDRVLVNVWLPLEESWNGRFQATGGGGFATGVSDIMLAPAVEGGYAAAVTDGGHKMDMLDLSWSLHDNKTVNWELLNNFAYRSLNDMVIVGKAVTENYYGKKPHHSYWNGCSMGGRQGYMMAQKYPDALDGILASAPALYMSELTMGNFWPQTVMQETKTFPSFCELQHILQAQVSACDMLDGVQDNVIEEYEACTFNPHDVVGSKVTCEEEEFTITSKTADVFQKFTQGPHSPYGDRLWYGFPAGTMPHAIISTAFVNGTRVVNPLGLSDGWLRYLVMKNPSFSPSQMGYYELFVLWVQSKVEYDWIFETGSTDLSAFRSAGKKLLTWHGVHDQMITLGGTIQYRQRVEMEMGGAKSVDEFYRLFLAPGVGHCGGGSGAQPVEPLAQLVDWVEKGEPPETLEASMTDSEGELVTRDICLYPKKAKYMGVGNWRRASSWSCIGGEEEEKDYVSEELKGFLGGLKQRIMGLL